MYSGSAPIRASESYGKHERREPGMLRRAAAPCDVDLSIAMLAGCRSRVGVEINAVRDSRSQLIFRSSYDE
jgi:hypothetical protein